MKPDTTATAASADRIDEIAIFILVLLGHCVAPMLFFLLLCFSLLEAIDIEVKMYRNCAQKWTLFK